MPLPPFLSPLVTTSLSSTSVSLFLLYLYSHLLCFLDSTYKWYHTVFVFLCLTYFTKHNTLSFHPYCCKWQNFIFYGYVLFYCTHTHTHTFCCYSVTKLCLTLWTAARQAPLSSIISWSLLRFMPIDLVMLPNHLTLCSYFFLILLKYSWFTVLCLISAVQESNSVIRVGTYIYIYIFIFFSIMVYHRILNIIPYATQLELVVYPCHTSFNLLVTVVGL